MNKRLELDKILRDIVNITEPDGSSHVYFQPPESVIMRYPAIRYSRTAMDNTHADNDVYKRDNAYEVIVIDKDPDSRIADEVSTLPTCRFVRAYTADNLNHTVFIIYY